MSRAVEHVQLGDVCELNPRLPREGRPSDADAVSFVPMAAVDEVSASIVNTEARPFQAVKKGFTYFRENDVLFAKITPCMENGKIALARDLVNGIGFGSTEFHVIRASNRVLPEWIRYFVLRPSYRAQAKRRMSGAVGQQRVPTEFLASSDLPLPPLNEQRRIVDLLARAENIVRMRREAESKAREIIPALFVEMFAGGNGEPDTGGDGHRGPENALSVGAGSREEVAEVVKLSDLAEVVSGVAKGRNLKGKVTREVPYLRTANVQAGELDLTEMKTIPATDAEIAELAVAVGDVLLTEGGDFDKVGRGALLEAAIGECIHQNHVFRVRVSPDKLTPEYFAEFLQTFAARQYFLKAAKKTSNLASINMTQLRNLPVPVPSLGAQRRFTERFRECRSIASHQSRAVGQARLVFQSLLAGVFGEGR